MEFSTHRVSARALIVEQDKLLLVKQGTDKHGVYWCNPGGGIEGSESLHDCLVREVREETGLNVTPGRLVYMRQFLDVRRQCMELHLFFTATVAGGALSGEARHPNDYSYAGEGFTHALRWMSRDEIQRVNVFPRDLKTLFWDDLARGFPEVRFLGVEREDL